MSLSHVRERFPALNQSIHGHPLVYLDSAATALKPQSVIDAVSDYYTSNCGTVHRAVYSQAVRATDAYYQARTKLASFLGAKRVEEIVWTRGTTESLNLVAHTFGPLTVQKGDEILISEVEHHANLIPWQMLCERQGAKLTTFPVDNFGDIDLQEYDCLLTPRTKIVAFAHVSNVTGATHPVKQMAEMAHRRGAFVVVDGAQAAPHISVDVDDLNVDFYAFSGHKCYGPTGVGVLYGKEEHLLQMPPLYGGGDMIDQVRFEKTTYAPPPARFEAGTPMIAQAIGLGVAIDFLREVGLQNIWQEEVRLARHAIHLLQEIDGVRVIGPAKRQAGIVSFIVEGVHPLDLGTFLNLKGLAVRTGHLCSQPAMERFQVSGMTRLSVGVYTTLEEIHFAVEQIRKVKNSLAV